MQESLEQKVELFFNKITNFAEVHLVGSALHNSSPFDIDLVVTMKSKENLEKKYTIIYTELGKYQESDNVSFVRAPSNKALSISHPQFHVLVEPDFTWPNATCFTRICWADYNVCLKGNTIITRGNFYGLKVSWSNELYPFIKAFDDFQLESLIFRGKDGYVPCEVNYSSNAGKIKLIKYSCSLFVNALIYKERGILVRKEEIPNYLNGFLPKQLDYGFLMKQLIDPDIETNSIQNTQELLLTIYNIVCKM
jgi:hypothetical protein